LPVSSERKILHAKNYEYEDQNIFLGLYPLSTFWHYTHICIIIL